MIKSNTYIYLKLVVLLAICVSMVQCKKVTPIILSEQDVATKWAELSLDITKNTPANSPTYASRCFAYLGLTMYESIVHGYPEYNSLTGQLNELDKLPTPEPSQEYNWPLALNAGQAFMLKNLYGQTVDTNKIKIDSLEELIKLSLTSKISDATIVDRSIKYGQSVAAAIYEWSKTDGGHRGYLNNFDKTMVQRDFPGSWKPPLFSQSFSHHPLHPHWGENRTFLNENKILPNPAIIPYDTAKTSKYYQQFLEVYEKDKVLTQAEKEAALWWGDDPSDTFTPPGHSYFIATLAIKAKSPPLIKCAETYARVGIAVADAFIMCWKWKYHFFSERPNTFIPKYIDQEWVSFWPDPPFPCFPSGHAIQASTAATVLMDLYGDSFVFVDRSHVGRERDEVRDVDFLARHFERFSDVAKETAASRFYGGIHTHQDNDVGLEEGKIIATNVNALEWQKD